MRSWNGTIQFLMPAVLSLGLCSCSNLPPRGRILQTTTTPEAGPPKASPPLAIGDAPQTAGPEVPQPPPSPSNPQVPAEIKPASHVETPPASPAPDPQTRLVELHREAARQIASMESYQMRLRRREVVQGRKRPEEIILVKFRQQPFSVYLKWLGTEAKDREVIYVKGRYDSLIHTKLAAGDVLLMPAGKRFSLPPDSFLAKSSSRHPITNAGLGHLVNQFGQVLAANAGGDQRLGSLKYLGTVKRPEFDMPVEGVLQTLKPQNDPLLPGGGRRLWYFDMQTHLPVLLITYDDRDQEVEYYCHDRILFPGHLDDDDFDPDKLWGQTKAVN